MYGLRTAQRDSRGLNNGHPYHFSQASSPSHQPPGHDVRGTRHRFIQTLLADDTVVTDEGLMLLKGLKKFMAVQVSETHVTDEGVQRFKAEIPQVRVAR